MKTTNKTLEIVAESKFHGTYATLRAQRTEIRRIVRDKTDPSGFARKSFFEYRISRRAWLSAVVSCCPSHLHVHGCRCPITIRGDFYLVDNDDEDGSQTVIEREDW